jgi:hypothetical protein
MRAARRYASNPASVPERVSAGAGPGRQRPGGNGVPQDAGDLRVTRPAAIEIDECQCSIRCDILRSSHGARLERSWIGPGDRRYAWLNNIVAFTRSHTGDGGVILRFFAVK